MKSQWESCLDFVQGTSVSRHPMTWKPGEALIPNFTFLFQLRNAMVNRKTGKFSMEVKKTVDKGVPFSQTFLHFIKTNQCEKLALKVLFGINIFRRAHFSLVLLTSNKIHVVVVVLTRS